MHTILFNLLLVVSVLVIVFCLMQPAKTESGLSSLTGGSSELFQNSKPRGFQAFLQRVTVVLLIIFFILSIALMYFT